MRKLEREEENSMYEDPERKVYHLCIVNLVIGTLYCAKGNFQVSESVFVFVCLLLECPCLIFICLLGGARARAHTHTHTHTHTHAHTPRTVCILLCPVWHFAGDQEP